MWGFIRNLSDGVKSFCNQFRTTSRAEENSYGFDINTVRDYFWPVLTALAVNMRFETTDDENDQTWAQLAYCSAVAVAGTLACWVLAMRRYQQQESSYKTARIQALEEFERKNVAPALAGTLLAIPAYNWAGYAFGDYLIAQGWNPYLATIGMASLATGYAEQGTQYFFMTEINKFIKWFHQYNSGYEALGVPTKHYQKLFAFFNVLLDMVKTLVYSFMSLRALGSFYPGGVWNAVFMGLTIALGLTNKFGNSLVDMSNPVYWAKLLLLVAPSVTLSVRFSNILVTMSTETLENWDAAIVQPVSHLGSRIRDCGSQLFFKPKSITATPIVLVNALEDEIDNTSTLHAESSFNNRH